MLVHILGCVIDAFSGENRAVVNYCAHAVIPGMQSNGGGSIIAVGSVNGVMGFGDPAYSAAKAGIIAIMPPTSLAVSIEKSSRGWMAFHRGNGRAGQRRLSARGHSRRAPRR